MSVVYIGDREVGKTSLAMQLADFQYNYVRAEIRSDGALDNESLKKLLYDERQDRFRPTENISYDRCIEIHVKLPVGPRCVSVDWIDTPGEIWRKSWQSSNPDDWKQFLANTQRSNGILLILPPYREILNPTIENPQLFITKQQWLNRFERWSDFFRYNCTKTRHLLICMNKADLFCNLSQEGEKLAFSPNHSQMTWQQRHNYVSNTYLRSLQPQIEIINRSISGLSVQCFITSIYNRSLLELPWIYLASYLAK